MIADVLPRIRRVLGRFGRRRVPVITQLTTTECGAACLAMILTYHGRATDVAECRDHLGTARDGATALGLAMLAREYGLRVKAYSAQPGHFRHLPLPAIVHWNFDHYLVVERWSPARVEVIDPALGWRTLRAEEFDAGFTGVVLTFEAGPDFRRRRGTRGRAWRAYLRRLMSVPGLRSGLTQVLAASVVLQLLALAVPAFTKVLVDAVVPLRLTDMLPILGLGLLLAFGAQLLTLFLRGAILAHLQGCLDSHVMVGFFAHTLSLPFAFFQQRPTGDLLQRFASNGMIRELVTGQVLAMLLDGVLVLVSMVLLLLNTLTFGLLVIGIGTLQVLVLAVSGRQMKVLTAGELAAEAESQSYLVEALGGIATLKAAGAEDPVLAHWSRLFSRQLAFSVRRGQLAAVIDTATTTLRAAAPALLLWVGVHDVLAGTMSLGTLLALNALSASVLVPLASLVSAGRQIQLAAAYVDRIADVLEASPEEDPARRGARRVLSGSIKLRNVSFRYHRQAPWAVRDVSLAIQPGQKVAIVGRTGSGKTTLILLLLGLFPPSTGEVLFDGARLDQMDLRGVRRQIGSVLQEPSLFGGTIRQAIAFGDPRVPLDRIVEAATLACIHDDIVGMPLGYETPIAEGGRALSGGQRQRIALARALLSRPPLLFLDEATSHLDADTELLLDRNLNDLACTRVIVAHRLSTVRTADLIVLLDNGQVVECGTHHELLSLNGRYAGLVRAQLEAPRAPSPLGFVDLTAAGQGHLTP